jgi:radical SAM superfamily enzyme YgiQ (UPF0313 family)
MNVLLVYPRFPQTFWSFNRALERVGRKMLLPPLGLITVAALLPASWNLRLVDVNVREVAEEDWAWADLVILSAMLVQRRDLALQISRARTHGVPVAVGGPFASSTPEAPELAAADHLILDEGEITIPLFVAAMGRGESRGLYRAGEVRPDLTSSPIPRFDLLELDAYDAMAVQFSRGCPFQCEFCDIIVLYGRKPRTKEPEQLLAEFDRLYALGWRGSLFLVDDNFIGNKRNVKRLLTPLLTWQVDHNFPFGLITEASVDLASDPELLELMAACRFERVFLGIETPDEASLALAHKTQNTRHPLEEAVDTITAHGLEVMAGFILGFDGEAAGAGDRIVAFVERTGIPIAMLGVLQALPNTALWHRLQREGRLMDVDNDFDRGVQTHLLNFRPTRAIEAIGGEFMAAFDALYEPRAFLDRIDRYCRKLGAPRWKGLRPRWHGLGLHGRRPAELIGVAGLIARRGLRDPDAGHFWRVLLGLALQRPGQLAPFLRLLVIHEHFLEYRQLVRQQVEAQLLWAREHRGEAEPKELVAGRG